MLVVSGCSGVAAGAGVVVAAADVAVVGVGAVDVVDADKVTTCIIEIIYYRLAIEKCYNWPMLLKNFKIG